MQLKKAAVAGTLESSDVQVSVEPGEGTLDISIQSSVLNQYGRQIMATVREVQEIATRSAACVKRIQQVYAKISAMKVDRRYTTNLLSLCSQTTRECVNITAYGAKIFTSNFLRMSDAERLNETRQVLDNIDKLLARVNYINLQADAVKFNNQLLNAYFK